MAANLVVNKHPDVTVKDITGLSAANIDTYIGTLVADTYTDIFICCATQAANASNLLGWDQVAALRSKMITASKGTTVNSGTCQANATVTEIKLAATASAVNDAYKGMYIVTAGTTATNKYIAGYVGATTTATVLTTTTAITTTETYIVYTLTNIHLLGDTVSATGKKAAMLAWENLWPSTPAPLAVIYLGGYLFCENSGTAQAVAAGTITLATTCAAGDRQITADQTTVDDLYKDMYVYVYSGTLGVWQYAKIASYVASTQVATLEANWLITPTGTVVYRVVSGIEKIRADRAMEIYAKTRWYDPTKLAAKQDISKLVNLYGELDVTLGEAPSQDLELLAKCVELGSFAFEADSTTYI
jgi:hypothetical protein